MKSKIVYTFALLFLIPMLFKTAYSTWFFNRSEEVIDNVLLQILDWGFTDSIFQPGTIIVVDSNGNIVVDGEIIEGETITEGNQQAYNHGDVLITVVVDDEGNLVLSEFTTTTTSIFAIFGNTIYLPTGFNIDGEIYPIVGVSEPLNINIPSVWFGFGNNVIHIPEGYTYLCDNAFASITNSVIFTMPTSMQTIGSGVFRPARNVTQRIYYAGTAQQWAAIDKARDYKKGQGTLSISYNR